MSKILLPLPDAPVIKPEHWGQSGISAYRVFPIHILGYVLHIIIGNSVNEIRNHPEIKGRHGPFTDDKDNPSIGLCTWKTDAVTLFIILCKEELSASLISHECLHAAKALLYNSSGLQLDDSSNELYAKVLESMVDLCMLTAGDFLTVKQETEKLSQDLISEKNS